MHPLVAAGVLVVYLLLSIETYLATYTMGIFKISHFKFGPTELRIVLAVGNILLLVHPEAHLFGRAYRLFDVGAVVAMVAMALTLVVAAASHTRTLYHEEKIW